MWGKIFLIFILLFSGVSVTSAQDGGLEYIEGEILVKFATSASTSEINTTIQNINGSIKKSYKIVPGLYLVQVFQGTDIFSTITVLEKNSEVEYAEPNYIRYATLTPNDPGFSYLWGLNNTGQTGGTVDADIDAPEAWNITTGSASNVIAVIDTGVDMTHQDLSSNIWTNTGEIPGNGIDDDKNGYIDDIHGWDFYANDNDPSDTTTCKHGTHVSGTIGAAGNNNTGVTGINWNVKIMPLRFLGGFLCSGSDANAIEAIEYATQKNIRISNNSWGGGGYDKALEDAIRNSKMLFIAAAGNGGSDGVGDNNDVNPEYPASYPLDNIISVAATDHNDSRASFSNYGAASVDLAAPGVNIASTIPGNKYRYFDGTSMATPHVSGVAGLLLSDDPSLENWQVIYKILQGADKKGLPVLTGGRLNAYNSLMISAPAKTRSEEPDFTYSGTWTNLTNPNFSGGSVKYSNIKNAQAIFSFSGSGIMWIASKAKMLGKADVYIDGIHKTTIDLYSPATINKEVVYSNLALGNGNHTLVIVVKGEKNFSATNTFVDIDAADVVY
jgi:subtilisin family serine protease